MRFFSRKKQEEIYRYVWPRQKILDVVAKHLAVEIVSDAEAPEARDQGMTFVKVEFKGGIFFALVLIGASPERREDICEMMFEMRVSGAATSPALVNEINKRLQLARAAVNDEGTFILNAYLIFPEKFSVETMEKLLTAWVADIGVASGMLVQFNSRSRALRQGMDRLFAGKANEVQLKSFDLGALEMRGRSLFRRKLRLDRFR